MKNQLSLLIITDHTSHIKSDSFYKFVNEFALSGFFSTIFLVSRGISENKKFFMSANTTFYVQEIKEEIKFEHDWTDNLISIKKFQFDIAFLRIDQPISNSFLSSLAQFQKKTLFINNPMALIETNSKKFLKKFKNFTPNIYITNSLKKIFTLSQKKDIVIKPLYSYGGKGISRIINNTFYIENNQVNKITFQNHIKQLLAQDKDVLIMDYLKNVSLGDKRILVCDGEIIGSILRIPSNRSWICNMNQGATSVFSNIDEEETYIVKQIDPILRQKGILLYGIDTLVGNNGKRVLSEINTANVGGFIFLEELTNKKIIKHVVLKLISFIQAYYPSYQKMTME